MALLAMLGRLASSKTVPMALLYVDPPAEAGERASILSGSEARGAVCVQVHSSAVASMLCRDAADHEMVERVRANEVPPPGEELDWAASILPPDTSFAGVLCGTDGGLADAERMLHALVPARSNGLLPARRDKFLANEALRAAGLATVHQASPSCWAEAEAFLRQLPQPPLPVVVKPRRGQASVMVGLASSLEQARHMFDTLQRSKVSIDSHGGGGVVLQALLLGKEFVVDVVSRAGEHKAVALWKYSKGERNGAPFVYDYDELYPCRGPAEQALVTYAFDTLDALGWRWGPAHVELMYTADGPRLIEVNAGRLNGCDGHGGMLLVQACGGTAQHEAFLDALFDETAWDALPIYPAPALAGAARLVKLISPVQGRLRRVHDAPLQALPSLISIEYEASEPGDHVALTVDLATCAGYALLLHSDEAQVEKDYQVVREAQATLFEVDE